MKTVTINCDDLGWGVQLLRQLNTQFEVTLINFDYCAYGTLCEDTASRFGRQAEHDPKAKVFRFKKP